MKLDSELPVFGKKLVADVLGSGDALGPWKIRERLDFGLTGGFYRGERAGQGSRCLLVLPSIFGQDSVFQERLQARVSQLSRLDHPHLLKVERVESCDGRLVVVYENYEGESLGRRLRERLALASETARNLEGKRAEASEAASGTIALPATLAGMPSPEAQAILTQVATALGSLHRAGFAHGEIGPRHIVVETAGHLKLVAYGLFDILDKELFANLVSIYVVPVKREGLPPVPDTLELRSPQLRLGASPSPGDDLYALGVLGYFLLTARLPDDPMVPPSRLRPELSRAWDGILREAAHADPEARFRHAAAFARQLAQVDDDAPSGAVVPTVAEQECQREAADGGSMEAPSPKSSPRAVRPTKRKVLLLAGLLLLVSGLGVAWLFFGGDNSDAITDRREKSVAAVEEAGKRPPEPAPVWAPTLVRSHPETHIFALGAAGTAVFVGQTDAEGVLRLDDRLLAGLRRLSFEKAGFAPAVVERELKTGEVNEWVVFPEPLNAHLTVAGDPEGAQLWFEGQNLGSSPLQLTDLPISQALQLTVRKEGYRDAQFDLLLAPGESRQLSYTLQPTLAVLEPQILFGGSGASAGQLLELRLWVNGQPRRWAPNLQVSAGKLSLKAEHPLYRMVETELVIKDGETLRVLMDLLPRPARVRLDLPVGAGLPTLAQDGQPVLPEEDGSYTIASGRRVNLTLQIPHFLPAEEVFQPEPTEELRWQPDLRPLPGPRRGEAFTIPYLNTRLVWVEAGNCTLGSPLEEPSRRPEEGPLTRLILSYGFWVAETETIQAFFQQVAGHNPSEPRGAKLPVNKVTHSEAMEMAKLLTERERRYGRLPEGYVYRLPTQAEWEYAARAGTSTPFFFGSTAGSGDGNFKGRYPVRFGSGEVESDSRYGPMPVASFPANAFGLFDVHGNVAEWCVDFFNARLPGGQVTDWKGESSGFDYPVRGGGWSDPAHRCRSAARERQMPSTRNPNTGFRLVLAPEIQLPESLRP